MKNSELLDAFKRKFGLETDADVAYVFDVTRPQIVDWRTEHRPIPMAIKWRLLDHLGYAGVRDTVLYFLPEEQHKALKKLDSERMLARAAAREAKKAAKKKKD